VTAPTAGVVFELFDETSAQDESRLFGLWTSPPASGGAAEVTFSAEAVASPQGPMLWRVNLPADPLRAEVALAAAQAHLRQTSDGLNCGATGAELEPTEQPLTFAPSDLLGRVHELVGRLLRAVGAATVVHTRQGDRGIAFSRVDLSGDLRTVFAAGLEPRQARLHVQALETALQSRALLARTATLVIRTTLLLWAGGPIVLLTTLSTMLGLLFTAVDG
jgi:hypothetical protein